MSKDQGWIRLYRSSFNNKFYFAEPFTRWQAWVDLLLLTNHKDGILRIRGNRIDIKRGQVGWSEEELAKRWKWSRGKVRRYFDELEKSEQQIVQQKSKIKSLLSIVNFDKYQSSDTTSDTADGTTDGHQTVQQTVQQTDTNKNVNNVKKENNDKNKEEKIDFVFWDSEKKNFLGAGDWIFNFCRDKKIQLDVFDAAASEFLNDLEHKEDYKDVKELKRHFTNWYNKNYIKNGKSSINGHKVAGDKRNTSESRIDALKKW